MPFRTSLTTTIAIVTVLAVGASPDALTAQDQKAIPGDAFTPDTGLREIPGDAFTPTRLRAFAGQDIVTIGDLVSADPALVGRILELDPQRARRMQQELRENMR